MSLFFSKITCYFLLLFPKEMQHMSPVLKLEGGTEARGRGGQYLSRTHLKSVYIHLCYLYSPLCTRTPSVVISCGWKIFYFPIPPFHAAFQVERISISLKLCHMSPLLSSSRFLKYRFKRSITDIHSYSLSFCMYCMYIILSSMCWSQKSS